MDSNPPAAASNSAVQPSLQQGASGRSEQAVLRHEAAAVVRVCCVHVGVILGQQKAHNGLVAVCACNNKWSISCPADKFMK